MATIAVDVPRGSEASLPQVIAGKGRLLMYEVRFDQDCKRLELRLWGFWSEDTMTKFTDELKQKFVAAKSRHKAFDLLSDASGMPVQAASITHPFGALIKSLEMSRYGRIAVVVGSALNKVQAERVEGGSSARIFRDRSAAIEWLSTGKELV